jgi:hypothetical protein
MFLWKTWFFKNVRNTFFLNILSCKRKYITFPCQKSSNFLFLEIVSFSRNFGKMSFLKKIPRFACFGGLKYAPHFACVYLQYASTSTWFRVIWIFSKFWNFVKGGYWCFCEKLDFSKRSEIRFFLIYCHVKQKI